MIGVPVPFGCVPGAMPSQFDFRVGRVQARVLGCPVGPPAMFGSVFGTVPMVLDAVVSGNIVPAMRHQLFKWHDCVVQAGRVDVAGINLINEN